jgi:RES domain-containing protein
MIVDRKLMKGDGGRANPPGIPYLYLATDPGTALAEMRPSVGQGMTVASFQIKKTVTVVLCRAGEGDWEEAIFSENPSPQAVDKHVWNDISWAFSRPVRREDEASAYAPDLTPEKWT